MVEESETELCARIDADDLNLPERLQQQVTFLENHPEVAVVGGQIYKIDSAGKVREKFNKVPLKHHDIIHLLLAYNIIIHPSVMFRRSAILKVGNYQNLPNVEDYDLWLRVAREYKLANLDNFVLKYRVHENSTTEIYKNLNKLTNLTNECFIKNAPSLYGCSENEVRLLRENRHPFNLLALSRIAKHLQKTQGKYWLDRLRSKSLIIAGQNLTSNRDIISQISWSFFWYLSRK